MSSVSAARPPPEPASALDTAAPQRDVAGRTACDEPVVADLDDLAHLPERLDGEVAAAFDVVPLLPARQRRDQVGIVDGDDRWAEHEAGRAGLADLEQRAAT